MALLGAGAFEGEVRPREAPPATAVFWAEANYVEVDAVVTDGQGYHVRGLTRDDFEILEEGIPQEIATFTEIALPAGGGRSHGDAAQSATEEAPHARQVATNEQGLEGRIYVIVLDALHTHPRRSFSVRKAARQFVDEHMTGQDIAAVVHTDGRTDAAQAFTSDRGLLRASIEHFMGRKVESAVLEASKLLWKPPEMLLPFDAQRVADARTAMATLESVVRGIADVHGRRKAILFFSEGSSVDTLDTAHDSQRAESTFVPIKAKRDAADVASALRDAIASAVRGNVAVYAIDPRGLNTPHGGDDMEIGGAYLALEDELRRAHHGLHALAEETGGFAALGINDFGSAYGRIVRANSRYYLLGYYPTDFRRDGKRRRIEVRVRQPDLRVAARDAYFRPLERDDTAEPGQSEDATSPELRELLERPWSQPGLTLGVTAAAFSGAGDRFDVAVTIEVPGSELPFGRDGDRVVNEVEVVVHAVDSSGRVRGADRFVAEPSLNAEAHRLVQRTGLRFVRRLELLPGRYQLRVAAREARQGTRGSVFYDLEVPDRGGEALAMSGVLLASRAAAAMPTPSIDAVVEERLDLPPTVARSFARGDELTAYAEVYSPADAGDVTVTAHVVGADGEEVFRTNVARATSDVAAAGLGHAVRIPLQGLSPGRYRLRIGARAEAGVGEAWREVSFDVVAPADVLAGDAGPSAEPCEAADAGSRMDRLEAWLAAIERHQPGASDEPATTIRAWGPAELAELAMDVAVTLTLFEDPDRPLLWLIGPGTRGQPRRSPYSTDDERRLRALAAEAAERCGDERGVRDDFTERCARNRLLKRGAILHTDAVVRVGDQVCLGQARGPHLWQVRFRDGEQRGIEATAGHWVLARSLLDNVTPDPEDDETVRLWYVATSAYGQHRGRYSRHEERAVELFPRDPHLLFFAASLHETFATPRVQSLARSIETSGDAKHGIERAESELKEAGKLYRRALDAEPSLVEARIRLGRVLHLLGRHEQAARELQQAVASLGAGSTPAEDEHLLAYYGELFLGASNDALGRDEAARAAYERASALYPDAPSPRLALSRLALRDGRHDEAVAQALQALRRPAADRDRDDPWWRYHLAQGRSADTWFDELYASLAVEP